MDPPLGRQKIHLKGRGTPPLAQFSNHLPGDDPLPYHPLLLRVVARGWGEGGSDSYPKLVGTEVNLGICPPSGVRLD